DGASGAESAALKCADGFQASEDADSTVVASGIGNGVYVRTGADGWQVRLCAHPASEGVAHCIFANSEASCGAQIFNVSSGATISFRKNYASEGGGGRVGEVCQLFEFG